jgi:hypothetical protein
VLILTHFLFALPRVVFGLGAAPLQWVLVERNNKRGRIPYRKLRNLRTKLALNSLGFDSGGEVTLYCGRQAGACANLPAIAQAVRCERRLYLLA